MGMTQVVPSGLAVIDAMKGEIVGPESAFEAGRVALRKEYQLVVEAAQRVIVIDSHEAAEEAVKLGRLLQNGVKESEGFFKKIKVQIDEIKRPVLEAEKADLGRLNGEKSRLGSLQVQWDAKVRREREEAERKAREEAERVAQEEALQRAIEMEAAGDFESAEAHLDEPVYALPVVAQVSSAPSIAGKVSRVNYSAKVTNLMALVQAVANGRAPIQALQADESFIKGQARSFKEGFSMPGCELVKEESVSYRS